MSMFFILLILTFIAQLIFPWWIIIPVSLVVSFYFDKKPWRSFFISFLAIFILWVLYSLYLSLLNDHILANRIGLLFGLPTSGINWLWVMLVSGLPGGIVAGLAGLTGSYTRKIIRNL